MKIPSTNNLGSSPIDSFQRAPKKPDAAKLAGANVSGPDAAHPAGTDGVKKGIDAYTKRMRAYASKIETRLQHALASPDLTRSQQSAIEQQVEKFRALMTRFEHAYFANGGGATNDMHKVLDNFSVSLNQILSGSHPASPSTGQPGALDTIA